VAGSVQFRWKSTADCIGFSFRNSGFDTRPFAPATPATLAGYAGQNSETERASGTSRSPSLFQSDYRIWMQLRPLREKSCVYGNRQSAIVRAGSLCGECGMKYEILRFAQDDSVFETPAAP
jgi:hypothetical protein